MNPRILHIETSSRYCSVALSEGIELVAWRVSRETNDHSATMAPMIAELLREQDLQPMDLQAVSVSIGPGSYTGLRIGLSTAKAICFATGCKLISIDTLESIARTAIGKSTEQTDYYVPVLDARRMDAYIAVFDAMGRRVEDNRILTIEPGCLDHLLKDGAAVEICGEGSGRWEILLSGLPEGDTQSKPQIRIRPLDCEATNLITIALEAFHAGDFAYLASCVPTYLKPPHITVPVISR